MPDQSDSWPDPIFLNESDSVIWGLTPRARLERALHRIQARSGKSTPPVGLVFRADMVFHENLVDALVRQPGRILVDGQNRPVAGHGRNAAERAILAEAIRKGRLSDMTSDFVVVDPAGLASTYDQALRRKGAPYLLSLETLSPAAIERRMYQESYKGVTDLVTKYLWPEPALLVTRLCARRDISPNMVTLVSFLCVVLATWLFAIGHFGAGLVAAWAMCFLDTVDGKLARCTLTSSKWGNVFDHGTDLIHPPFWYWAWYVGLGGAAAIDPWIFWIIIAGYILGRAQEGLFMWQFGIEIHIWRPLDSFFRLITARRNPNLIILSIAVAFGAPDTGFELVAWWTIISFLFHCVRIAQAFIARSRGARPVSWLMDRA
jgi:phosphatidylglycerophosphate synthase